MKTLLTLIVLSLSLVACETPTAPSVDPYVSTYKGGPIQDTSLVQPDDTASAEAITAAGEALRAEIAKRDLHLVPTTKCAREFHANARWIATGWSESPGRAVENWLDAQSEGDPEGYCLMPQR